MGWLIWEAAFVVTDQVDVFYTTKFACDQS